MTLASESDNTRLPGNSLIDSLPAAQRQRLLSLCRTCSIEVDSVLSSPERAPKALVFPLSGLVSESSGSGDWGQVQLHGVGSEGVVGAGALLARGMPALRSTTTAAGLALVIDYRSWRAALQVAPRLLALLQRYHSLHTGQLARAAVCLGFHEAQPRLARWLLAAADRSDTEHLTITHERLAVLLGLRRSGVTVCAGRLHVGGLIDYRRGEIRILDREGLENAACDCYADDLAAHALAFPP